MKYRKLRIAVSVFFGLLTVALVVLWVRSYWCYDALHSLSENRSTSFLSVSGIVSVASAAVLDEEMRQDLRKRLSFGWTYKSEEQPDGWQSPHRAFEFKRNSVFTALTVPHWFAMLLLAFLAVLPWLRWPHSTIGRERQDNSCT